MFGEDLVPEDGNYSVVVLHPVVWKKSAHSLNVGFADQLLEGNVSCYIAGSVQVV